MQHYWWLTIGIHPQTSCIICLLMHVHDIKSMGTRVGRTDEISRRVRMVVLTWWNTERERKMKINAQRNMVQSSTSMGVYRGIHRRSGSGECTGLWGWLGCRETWGHLNSCWASTMTLIITWEDNHQHGNGPLIRVITRYVIHFVYPAIGL